MFCRVVRCFLALRGRKQGLPPENLQEDVLPREASADLGSRQKRMENGQ